MAKRRLVAVGVAAYALLAAFARYGLAQDAGAPAAPADRPADLVATAKEKLKTAQTQDNCQEVIDSYLTKAVAQAPDMSAAHFYLGQAYLRMAVLKLCDYLGLGKREYALATELLGDYRLAASRKSTGSDEIDAVAVLAQTEQDPARAQDVKAAADALAKAEAELKIALGSPGGAANGGDLGSPSGPNLYLARISLLRGQLTKAEAQARAEVACAPESGRPEACLRLGEVLARQGRLVDGLQAFQWAVDRDHNFVQAMFFKAQILYDLRRYDQCVALCDDISAILRRYKMERATIDRIRSSISANQATSTRQAQETLEDLIERYPRVPAVMEEGNQIWPFIYRLQGLCFHSLKRYAQARASYLSAMSPRHAGNPNDADIRTLTQQEYLAEAEWVINVEGRAIDPLKLLKVALDNVDKILKDSTAYPPAQQVKGEIYLFEAQTYEQSPVKDIKVATLAEACKEFETAISDYTQARAGGSKLPEARSGHNLARCYASYGLALSLSGDTAKALAQFDAALAPAADPQCWEALVYKLYTLAQSDPLGKAEEIQALTARAKGLPNQVFDDQYNAWLLTGEAHVHVAHALRESARRNGDTKEIASNKWLQDASGMFAEAARLAPRDPRAQINAAACYFDLNQLRPATLAYEQCVDLIPLSHSTRVAGKRAEVLLQLAQCYASSGRPDEVIKRANEAYAVSSQLWQAKELLGDAYTALHRYQAAEIAYQGASQQAPKGSGAAAKVLASQGHLYVVMGKYQDAEVNLIRALDTFAGTNEKDLTAAESTSRQTAKDELVTVRQRLAESKKPTS